MSRVSCPYCYHKINGSRLWYQCTGRGSPGRKGCAPARDEARERETGFNEQVRPVFGLANRSPIWPAKAECPTCGAQSGIRACPRCHTPLSSNFGASVNPLIAMVGAKGTGKSVYLTVLAHQLLNDMSGRFDADVRMSGISQRRALGGDQLEISTIFDSQRLFEQSAQAVNGRQPPTVFEWRREHRIAGIRRFRTSFLSFYDTAGEDLTAQETTHDLTYLGAASALILLLDPFMIPQARQLIRLPTEAVRSTEATVDVVNRVTEKLRVSHSIRSTRAIRIPVAVAFAKMDAFFPVLGSDHPLLRQPSPTPYYDDVAGQATHEQVRAVLADWGGDDIDRHLRFNYANFRYFAVSSLGAPPDYTKGAVNEGGVRPFRVAEPLLWLLSQFNVVPRQRQR
ncbi:hypothetical protein [Micromonospora sp. DT229]|uniref:hypothetical protein n=1 Tax=Micromonospora sp. DT229 TaxID=3393430 RepID=UPI003CF8CDA6